MGDLGENDTGSELQFAIGALYKPKTNNWTCEWYSDYNSWSLSNWIQIKKKILFISFRERGREGEKERNTDVWHLSATSHMPPTGDLAHNPGKYPEWELNQRAFTLWDNTQPTEPHQ